MPSSSSTASRSSIDEKLSGFAAAGHDEDLEALDRSNIHLPPPPPLTTPQSPSSTLHKLLAYPPPNSLKLRPTSYLDGVRGVAAFGVYLFHAMGIWASLVPAYGASPADTSPLQLPLIRTIFVSGGAAVALFFALSGYVLTHKSLRWIRQGESEKVGPGVASSMFRRGFRLYLPPILLTFCEMVATRFGVVPPLSFSFVAEESFWAQFLDWVRETNRLINPLSNFGRAVQGYVTHLKYDAVIWTMPLEYYGSFFCYILLLMMARISGDRDRTRMGIVAVVAAVSMLLGSWNMFCFAAGMGIADFTLGQDLEADSLIPPAKPTSNHGALWTAIFAISFYVAGFPTLVYPEAKVNPMPGFETLRSLTPMSLNMEDHSRFLWSLSGILLLLSISQLPRLKAVFETNFCQYLGRISFSLYLVHEFCLVLFGLSLQGFFMRMAGLHPKESGLVYWLVCGVWFLAFTVPCFAVAAQVERWVDGPSVRFARWLEGRCLKIWKR
jgi:peptidoglycan/LPS O-acetylase OafA/YrhL